MRASAGHLTLLAALFATAACSGEQSDCGGHGKFHRDHCHCDTGYANPAGDPLSCVAATGGSKGLVDGGVTGDPDAGRAAEDAGGEADAGALEDAAVVADAGSGPEARSFAAVRGEAQANVGHDGDRVWLYSASNSAGELLRVEIYDAFGGPSEPGRVVLDAREADYASCGTCVLFMEGCSPMGCARTFMPSPGGVVVLEAMGTRQGERFAGRLEGLTFEEVTIDPRSFATTRVPGGQRFTLADLAWDQALPEPPCSGHGHLHGDVCHCDPGYRVDPEDARRCIPR